ncbi:MAG TPA: hypothetical protein PLP17_09335 [Oligoflexia bacterium]|nr:hypothetical protein [Oligoflexia bacterium]
MTLGCELERNEIRAGRDESPKVHEELRQHLSDKPRKVFFGSGFRLRGLGISVLLSVSISTPEIIKGAA